MLEEIDEHELDVSPVACFEVTIKGEIDLGRRDELMSIVEVYESGDDVDVLMDLSAVTFMDSTGLGVLAQLSRLARERGGKVTLAHVDPRVEKVILLTHLDHVIDIAPEAIDLSSREGQHHAVR